MRRQPRYDRRKQYPTFSMYERRTPGTVSLLSKLVGHPFTQQDAITIFPLTNRMREALHDGIFKVEPCVEWPVGKPFE